MDIRQLEAFVYTVKYQSFSLAAQKLYISQPTVSAHIRSLEEEFHTQLLKRTTKSLSLTPAGTKLYSYATEILTLQQKAIVELANETKPQLRIGASSVPSLYFLPELLSAYHAVHSDIRVYASCSDSLDVVHKVDDGICDIGLVGTTTSDTSCEFLPFASDELVIAAPATPHYQAYQSCQSFLPICRYLRQRRQLIDYRQRQTYPLAGCQYHSHHPYSESQTDYLVPTGSFACEAFAEHLRVSRKRICFQCERKQ